MLYPNNRFDLQELQVSSISPLNGKKGSIINFVAKVFLQKAIFCFLAFFSFFLINHQAKAQTISVVGLLDSTGYSCTLTMDSAVGTITWNFGDGSPTDSGRVVAHNFALTSSSLTITATTATQTASVSVTPNFLPCSAKPAYVVYNGNETGLIQYANQSGYSTLIPTNALGFPIWDPIPSRKRPLFFVNGCKISSKFGFKGQHIYVKSENAIIVNPNTASTAGSNFYANRCWFHTCGARMWIGFVVNSCEGITLENTRIDDAEVGVRLNNGRLLIRKSRFHNNYVGLFYNHDSPLPRTEYCSDYVVRQDTFESIGTFLPITETGVVPAQMFAGIWIARMPYGNAFGSPFKLSAKNLYTNGTYGFYYQDDVFGTTTYNKVGVIDSDRYVNQVIPSTLNVNPHLPTWNRYTSTGTNQPYSDYTGAGVKIIREGLNANSPAFGGAFTPMQTTAIHIRNSRFENCDWGVLAMNGMHTSIRKCYFENTDSIAILAKTFSNTTFSPGQSLALVSNTIVNKGDPGYGSWFPTQDNIVDASTPYDTVIARENSISGYDARIHFDLNGNEASRISKNTVNPGSWSNNTYTAQPYHDAIFIRMLGSKNFGRLYADSNIIYHITCGGLYVYNFTSPHIHGNVAKLDSRHYNPFPVRADNKTAGIHAETCTTPEIMENDVQGASDAIIFNGILTTNSLIPNIQCNYAYHLGQGIRINGLTNNAADIFANLLDYNSEGIALEAYVGNVVNPFGYTDNRWLPVNPTSFRAHIADYSSFVLGNGFFIRNRPSSEYYPSPWFTPNYGPTPLTTTLVADDNRPYNCVDYRDHQDGHHENQGDQHRAAFVQKVVGDSAEFETEAAAFEGITYTYETLHADSLLRDTTFGAQAWHDSITFENAGRLSAAVQALANNQPSLAASIANTVSANTLAEGYAAQVTAIEANLSVSHPDTLSNTQLADLLIVANTCRQAGGAAVLEARNLLWQWVNLHLEFSDSICPAVPAYRKKAPRSQLVFNTGFRVFPNPANVFTTVSTSTDGILAIYDVIGRQIASFVPQEGSQTINLCNIAPGFYNCVFSSFSGKHFTTKLLIAR